MALSGKETPIRLGARCAFGQRQLVQGRPRVVSEVGHRSAGTPGGSSKGRQE